MKPAVAHKALKHLKLLLEVYFLGIAFFSFFRLLLVFTNLHYVKAIGTEKYSLLFRAMVMGWRFDTVIACYILGLPVVVLGISFLFSSIKKWLLKLLYIYTGIFFSLALLICSADIPFFNYFFSRLNDTVFNWMGNAGFGFRMIIQEPGFLIFFFIFLGITVIYLFFLRKIYKNHVRLTELSQVPAQPQKMLAAAPFVLLLWGLIFLGIRGRMSEKSPIIPGTAFFSSNPFINQLGLNPVFTLLRSTLDNLNPENKHFHKIENSAAFQTMAGLLHADPALKDISPIARRQFSDAPMRGKNIILVIMESMTTAKMGRFGNKENLTPFLDSLSRECWSFDRIYSAGIHTYNGIYSTLFAHPAIMKKHSMEVLNVPEMAGFPNVLQQNGYQTIFFTTHDEMFDNMSGFLTANGFAQIIGEKDYPAREVKSTLGVPDEFMFRFSVPKLNELADRNKPFFAAFMTGSDHDPYIIPEESGFKRRHPEDKKAIVEFADWSLKKLMEYASQQIWFQNTIFVFVADHGGILGYNAYDIAFSYHHIPFLIFAPGATKPETFLKAGLQTDVFPTVTSLVLPEYINNTFGIDLRKDQRPYLVFSADDKLACMNDSLLYIYRNYGDPGLYRYQNNNTHNFMSQFPAVADTMQKIAFSWLQTSEWMLLKGKTGLGPPPAQLRNN